MAKKKEAQEAADKSQASRRKPAGKSQATRKKVKEAVEEFMEDVKPFDLCVVFAQGDNIDMIAKQLTGKSYMAFKVCEYSGVRYQDVRPGTILKWPMR